MAKRGDSNWIPAVVAVVAIGAFLGWLLTQQPEQSTVVAEPGDTTAAPAARPVDAGSATRLTADQMSHSARLDDLVGQTVMMDSVNVIGTLGEQMFWAELSSGDLYLVKLDSALVASGATPPASGRVTLIGRVQQKNQATLDQWMQAGVLRSEGDRAQAEFGLSYLEAARVEPVGGA